MIIRAIMSQHPISCNSSISIADAAQLMHLKNVGFIPVLDGDQRLTGVITDRDIVCRAIAAGKDPATTMVVQCMSRPAVSMVGDADLDACLETMKRHQVKRIVAVEHGARIGIVSLADLVGKTAPEQVGDVVAGIVESKISLESEAHIPAG